MLRESIEMKGGSIDFDGLTDPSCNEIRGVPNSRELLQLADACLGDDSAALVAARQALVDKMGSAAMIDTVGVISNFQRMVRIADATGHSVRRPHAGDVRGPAGTTGHQPVCLRGQLRATFPLSRAVAQTRWRAPVP